MSINHDGADRSLQIEAKAREIGFCPAPPLFAVGTPVVEYGQDRFRTMRDEWEALPLVEEVASDIACAIEKEERSDLEVKAEDLGLIVDPEGVWTAVVGNDIFPLEEGGAKGLLQRFGIPTRVFNTVAKYPKSAEQAQDFIDSVFAAQAGTLAKLRMRRRNGDHSIYAAVSERYGELEHAKIWREVADTFKGRGARAEGKYDPDGTRAVLKALWVPEVKPEEVVAGEFFRAGVVLSNRDDGGAAVKVDQVLWRNLCLNLIIIDMAKITRRIKHFGTEVTARAIERTSEALKNISVITDAWTAARRNTLQDRFREIGIDGVFKKLVEYDIITKPAGVGVADFVSQLQAAWLQEPGYDQAAIANAVSRCAHEQAWQNAWVTEELEREAGKLLLRAELI